MIFISITRRTAQSTNQTLTLAAMTVTRLLPPASRLSPIGNYTLVVGQALNIITNIASDADVPSQTLMLSLFGAPAGATITTDQLVFNSRPAIA